MVAAAQILADDSKLPESRMSTVNDDPAERWAWRAGQTRKLPPKTSTRTRAFTPMAPRLFESRAAGKGGQFAKGGGRVPGRGALSSEQLADFATPSGASAQPHLEPDGQGGVRFTAERAALHERILAEHLQGVEGGLESPELVMLGGGPGAGKSTTAGQLGVPPPPSKGGTAAWADPDAMKASLPEYDPKDPGPVHEESSYLAKEYTKRALALRANVVVDGVGDNPASVGAKVATARAAGYRTRAAYTTTDVDMAQARNLKRERSVPPTLLAAKHAKVSKVFDEVANLDFDSVQLWENLDGRAPTQVAFHEGRGSALTVTDPAAWARFKAKGDL